MADGGENKTVLECFLDWCKQNDLSLCSKVKVGTIGSCHRYGMVATDNIVKGETVFEIPRTLLLSPSNCSISHLLNSCEFWLPNGNQRSGWAPLLVALMYEHTYPTSFWKPYLNLVPTPQALDQPMFWTEGERQSLLCNTGIGKSVEEDLNNIEEEFSSIVLPFLKKHAKDFDKDVHTLSLYKHMVGFVMAYSFTEESPDLAGQVVPVMVPMADILNHHSYNNAHLEFGNQSLKMVAINRIEKGQEVFNTYGKLGNAQLLQMYGFVEETPNPYDSVDIPVQFFRKRITRKFSPGEKLLIDAKFQLMTDAGLVRADDMFHFNKDGCSHYGPDLAVFLKILHLTAAKLRQLVNELLNPSSAFSEEFEDIRDEICETIDLNLTLKYLDEIFCEEVKFSHVCKRANASCSTNISNELCENILVKRKRVSQQAVENRIGEQDFLGNGNSVYSEGEEVRRDENVSREKRVNFSNGILVQSSRKDNCYARTNQLEKGKESEYLKKYKVSKEGGEVLNNLGELEEEYEDQPEKEKGEEEEEEDKNEEVDYEEKEDDQEGLRSEQEQDEEVDYEETEDDQEGLGSEQEQDEEVDYEETEDDQEGIGIEQEQDEEVDYEETEDDQEGLGSEQEQDEEVDYEETEDDQEGLESEQEQGEEVDYEESDDSDNDDKDDTEDDKDQVLTYEQIAAFPAKWRETLASTAETYLHDKFGSELKEELVFNPNAMSQRQKAVQQIKLGMVSLLKKIIKCNSQHDSKEPNAGINEH